MNRKLLAKAFLFFTCLPWVSGSYAQTIITVAGTGSSTFSGDGGPATAAGVTHPIGGCFDKLGNFYFADEDAQRVRKVDIAGHISTVAGNGTGGFLGDSGPATAAELNFPYSVQTDTSGNILYIADQLNHRIRKVNMATGVISTFAGTGISGISGEGGPATAANIMQPVSIAVDKFNNVFIATGDNKVHKVNGAGIITTIAGTGAAGFDGDGAPAISALLNRPGGLAVDNAGNLYIAELISYANRVRMVNTAGIISTVAGNGTATYAGDGMPATAAAISPFAVATDALNNLFIADNANQRIYKVDAATHTLHRIAGTGLAGDTGDGGPATAATLNSPVGIATDMCGNVYVGTYGNPSIAGSGRRVREIIQDATHPPVSAAITAVPGDTVCSGMAVTFTASATGNASLVKYAWIQNAMIIPGETNSTFTLSHPSNGDSVTCQYTYRENCSGDTFSVFSNGIVMSVLPPGAPTISLSATTPALFGSTVTVNATVGNAGSGYDIKWMDNGILFAITTTSTITYVKLAGIDTITAMATSHSAIGCYDSATSAMAIVSGTPVAGVNNVGAAEEWLSVYPNPAHGYLNISGISAGDKFTISNMAGQAMVHKTINNAAERIDIAALPVGVYVVSVTHINGAKAMVKMVKE